MDWTLILYPVRFSLALLLIVAAAAKLRDARGFTGEIKEYELIPIRLATGLGWVLPPIELILGVSLLLGLFLPITAALTAVLLLVFAAAMFMVVRQGRRLRCHCFGGLSQSMVSLATVGRNIAFAAASIVVAVWPPGFWSLATFHGQVNPASSQPPALSELLLVTFTVVGVLLSFYLVSTLLAVTHVARGRTPSEMLRI